MTAMEIDNPIRIQALLLHYGGPDLDEIHDTLTIEEPDEDHDTYVRSKEALTAYFTPKKNTAFEIDTFRQAAQLDGEKIDTFVTRLRKLSKSCDFTEPDKEIANQLIFSCSSQPLRRRALRDDLALVKLAISLEISDIQVHTAPTDQTSEGAPCLAVIIIDEPAARVSQELSQVCAITADIRHHTLVVLPEGKPVAPATRSDIFQVCVDHHVDRVDITTEKRHGHTSQPI